MLLQVVHIKATIQPVLPTHVVVVGVNAKRVGLLTAKAPVSPTMYLKHGQVMVTATMVHIFQQISVVKNVQRAWQYGSTAMNLIATMGTAPVMVAVIQLVRAVLIQLVQLVQKQIVQQPEVHITVMVHPVLATHVVAEVNVKQGTPQTVWVLALKTPSTPIGQAMGIVMTVRISHPIMDTAVL